MKGKRRNSQWLQLHSSEYWFGYSLPLGRLQQANYLALVGESRTETQTDWSQALISGPTPRKSTWNWSFPLWNLFTRISKAAGLSAAQEKEEKEGWKRSLNNPILLWNVRRCFYSGAAAKQSVAGMGKWGEAERQTCFEMRLERQPSLQLRESLNVCWEGWRETEGEWREEEMKEWIEVKRMEGAGAGRVVTDAVCGWQRREQRQVCQSTSNCTKQGERRGEKNTEQWRKKAEMCKHPAVKALLIHLCTFSALIRVSQEPPSLARVLLFLQVCHRHQARIGFFLKMTAVGSCWNGGKLELCVCFFLRWSRPGCCLWSLLALPELQTAHQAAGGRPQVSQHLKEQFPVYSQAECCIPAVDVCMFNLKVWWVLLNLMHFILFDYIKTGLIWVFLHSYFLISILKKVLFLNLYLLFCKTQIRPKQNHDPKRGESERLQSCVYRRRFPELFHTHLSFLWHFLVHHSFSNGHDVHLKNKNKPAFRISSWVHIQNYW